MNGSLNSGGYIKVSSEGWRPGVYRGKLRPPPPWLYTELTDQTPPLMIQQQPELDEELGSKSSEAMNNGVTPGSSPANGEGRPSQGQTLHVGNLGLGVEDSLLVHYFAPYGRVVNVQVIRDRDTRISRGYAFVTYAHPIYARAAMQHMDSVQIPGPFEGRTLKVSFSNRR